MLSSTSSFNRQPPSGPVLRPLAAGVLLALLALAAWEAVWRARGFTPSVNDDAMLWAHARLHVPADEPGAVVFAGTSRALSGLVPEVFAVETGLARPIQLGNAGGSPWPVLDHFAEDSRFRGLLIVDVTPVHFFHRGERGPGSEIAEERIARFEAMRVSPFQRMEAALRIEVQGRMVSRLPALAPIRLAEVWRRGHGPEPPLWTLTEERYRYANDGIAPERWAERARLNLLGFVRHYENLERQGLKPTPAVAVEVARRANARVARIAARGGRVVFVQMPRDGTALDFEEQTFPRAEYWDVFAGQTPALTVHYADFAETAGLRCVDQSHLGRDAAIQFTRALARILRERGALPEAKAGD